LEFSGARVPRVTVKRCAIAEKSLEVRKIRWQNERKDRAAVAKQTQKQRQTQRQKQKQRGILEAAFLGRH